MISAKVAELIEMPFVLWTQVSRWKLTFNCFRQVAPMCHHWRQPPNTIEPCRAIQPYVKLLLNNGRLPSWILFARLDHLDIDVDVVK